MGTSEDKRTSFESACRAGLFCSDSPEDHCALNQRRTLMPLRFNCPKGAPPRRGSRVPLFLLGPLPSLGATFKVSLPRDRGTSDARRFTSDLLDTGHPHLPNARTHSMQRADVHDGYDRLCWGPRWTLATDVEHIPCALRLRVNDLLPLERIATLGTLPH